LPQHHDGVMSKSEEVDADVVAKIVGKWKSFKVKNLEKLMKAMGAPWAVRKLASKFSPVTEISIDGDTIVEVLQMMKTYTQELVIGAAPIKGTSGPMVGGERGGALRLCGSLRGADSCTFAWACAGTCGWLVRGVVKARVPGDGRS